MGLVTTTTTMTVTVTDTPSQNDTAISLQEKDYLNEKNCSSEDMDQHESLVEQPVPYQGCTPIDIEFVDLTYTVPVGRNGQ